LRRVSRGLVETEKAVHEPCVSSAASSQGSAAWSIRLISHTGQHLPSEGPGTSRDRVLILIA
jgi:hypothetical protein